MRVQRCDRDGYEWAPYLLVSAALSGMNSQHPGHALGPCCRSGYARSVGSHRIPRGAQPTSLRDPPFYFDTLTFLLRYRRTVKELLDPGSCPGVPRSWALSKP